MPTCDHVITSTLCNWLQADTTPTDVISFIEKHSVPLVGQYNRQSKNKMYKDRRPLVLFFYTVDWTFEHREGLFVITNLLPVPSEFVQLQKYSVYAY